MTTKEAIRDAVTLVLEGKDIKEAYLFDSYARGDELPGSDVYLRFLCGKSMTFGQLDEIREELENKLGLSLDIVTAPPSQMSPRLYNRIKQDEVLLYEA